MSTTAPLDRESLTMLRAGLADHPSEAQLSGVQPLAPVESPGRGHLRPVLPAAQPRRGRSPLLVAFTAVGIVLAILAAQLGLSIAVSQGAYEVRALELEQRDLGRVERVLSQNVDKLSSPQNLAENAGKLGMVQNATPAALRLSDHKVLGSLKARTSAVNANLVPNAALKGLPVVNAEGLLVSRNSGQAAEAARATSTAPVAWRGRLPAPDTH